MSIGASGKTAGVHSGAIATPGVSSAPNVAHSWRRPSDKLWSIRLERASYYAENLCNAAQCSCGRACGYVVDKAWKNWDLLVCEPILKSTSPACPQRRPKLAVSRIV